MLYDNPSKAVPKWRQMNEPFFNQFKLVTYGKKRTMIISWKIKKPFLQFYIILITIRTHPGSSEIEVYWKHKSMIFLMPSMGHLPTVPAKFRCAHILWSQEEEKWMKTG